ncbi:hypothetical protein DFJ73DRAFT_815030 [Zopfochytrium polystomum]|nr:hypothetical protein DFJ73DRAFT_815030 [Zopfochytrium polystomum]
MRGTSGRRRRRTTTTATTATESATTTRMACLPLGHARAVGVSFERSKNLFADRCLTLRVAWTASSALAAAAAAEAASWTCSRCAWSSGEQCRRRSRLRCWLWPKSSRWQRSPAGRLSSPWQEQCAEETSRGGHGRLFGGCGGATRRGRPSPQRMRIGMRRTLKEKKRRRQSPPADRNGLPQLPCA